MTKIDYKKELKHLYQPSAKEVSIVNVPAMNYLMLSGTGGPDSPTAIAAIQTLFPIAYKIKFISKDSGTDYGVMPLEGLWWADDMNDFVKGNRDKWNWTYMIMQPTLVKQELFAEAVIETKKKKDLPMISEVEFKEYYEGQSAQLMHIGPFSAEGPNIAKVHRVIANHGGTLTHKHHEIYLNDFRKVNPVNMKTILRQPFTI